MIERSARSRSARAGAVDVRIVHRHRQPAVSGFWRRHPARLRLMSARCPTTVSTSPTTFRSGSLALLTFADRRGAAGRPATGCFRARRLAARSAPRRKTLTRSDCVGVDAAPRQFAIVDGDRLRHHRRRGRVPPLCARPSRPYAGRGAIAVRLRGDRDRRRRLAMGDAGWAASCSASRRAWAPQLHPQGFLIAGHAAFLIVVFARLMAARAAADRRLWLGGAR